MSTATTSFYVTGGTLRSDAPSYVERGADRDLYEGLSRGEFCYVLTARQMGKSSLMVRTAARLREAGVAVVVLDLTTIGQNLSAEQWYDGLQLLMGQQLDLEDELEDFWRERSRLGPLQRWLVALREVVLDRVPGRIVIFVDEIDTVRSLPFSTDEFFAAIRACYNRRTEDPEFHRLTFCLLGVASPSDLIQDTRLTPFNIGRRIELTDFSEGEAAPLASGLGRNGDLGMALLVGVLHWTGGHPYLTQRLCQAVAEDATVTDGAGVDRLCDRLFLTPQARERDDNLLFVRERLLRSEADLASLLGLYEQVRRGRRVRNDETNPLVSLLRLAGITRAVNGCLQVRNRIYARVFDREWIREHMPDAELRRQRAAYRRGLLRATAISAVLLAVIGSLAFTAVVNARVAKRQQRRAEQGERIARREGYLAQMNLAQQAWDAGNVGLAQELVEAQRPKTGQEDLRGFEWRYLWRLCQHGDARYTLQGDPAWVGPVALSPDGRTLASGGADKTVRLWDLATGRNVAILKGHQGTAGPLLFSPDGKLLASGSDDHIVNLWDVASQRATALRGHSREINAVAFSPDNRILASASEDGAVKLWDIASGREIATLKGHTGAVHSLAFAPDGRLLATGGLDTTIKLWDVASRRLLATLRGDKGAVMALAFSPGGEILASAPWGGKAEIWNVATKRKVATLRGHRATVLSVAFSPDGKLLASGGGDTTVKLWAVATAREVATLRGHTDEVDSVAFSRDGKTLVSGSSDKTAKLWDVIRNRKADILQGHTDEVHSVAFSPDGKVLATGSFDRTVKLWDVTTGREIAAPKRHKEPILCVAFSPDGKILASGTGFWFAAGKVGKADEIKLWDGASGREVATLRGQRGAIWSVAFSADGRFLASANDDKSVTLWDVPARREWLTLPGSSAWGNSLAFSPDGNTLATLPLNQVKLWEVASRRDLATLPAPARPTHIVFSPNGRTVAACNWWDTLTVWDLATKRGVTSRKTLCGSMSNLAFSPDGKRLATVSEDNSVRLWDVTTVRVVTSLQGDEYPASVAFSPDGNTLASASGTRVRLWRAATFTETDAPAGTRPSSR